MSLVINANEDGSFLTQSNGKILNSYPNFNSLLLLLYGQTTSFSRNGTSVDIVSQTINNINYNNGALGTSGDIGTENNILDVGTPNNNTLVKTASSTFIKKIMLNGELSGGEVIGKNIFFPEMRVYSSLYSSGSSSLNNKIEGVLSGTILIQLLHKDGTLTTAGTISLNNTYSWSNTGSGLRNNYIKTTSSIIEGDGAVAQEGDVVIANCNIINTITTTFGGNASFTSYGTASLRLGKLGSIDEKYQPTPIQISIE